MEGSELVFCYFNLLYYKCHEINPNCGGSNIDSPDWIKNKKATVYPIKKKKDNKSFQYAVTGVLNYEEIEKITESITKIKLFINKYEWERINFPQKKMIGKKLRKIM